MSLIEQAAKRLDELRRAGVEVPESREQLGPGAAAPASLIERATHEQKRIESLRGGAALVHADPVSARAEPTPVRVEPAPVRVELGSARTDSAQSRLDSTPSRVESVPSRSDRGRPIIHLNLAGMAARGVITPDAPRSQLSDEYRVVKRPLIFNASGKGATPVRDGNLIMVTSALPKEGKTFTATNLAMSIAMELDHTVLLVDADVARPSVPQLLGIDPAPGLLDVLVDPSVDLSDVILKTNVPKLSLLLAGTQHPRATELLASEAMNRLLAEVGRRYNDRIIIFDSPPLLVTTESRVLAAHMGQIVIVVESRKTTQFVLRQALATIESCPIKLMLLNKGRLSADAGSYGYGYGYGYGVSSTDSDADATGERATLHARRPAT